MSFSGKVINRKDNLPMANIPVSDGRNTVFTDENGRFLLPGWGRARMINVALLTERHCDWYMPIEGHVGDFDFVIDPTKEHGDFCFLHTSDTEVEGRYENEWISFAKDCVKKNSPAFFMHTGDLCREDGVKRHYLVMNRETVGCPVRYCIGNHDFIGEKYGEEIYEKLYGPCWYSFDCGKYHFVCLSIGAGDNPSGYAHEDQWIWLMNDLETAGKGKKLVICCHDLCASDPTGFTKKIGDNTLDLKEKGLCAWIYGHYHINAAHEYDGVINATISRPDSGGIDSSPAGFRIVNFTGENVTTEVIFNTPECEKPDTPVWQTKISGNAEFSSLLSKDGALYIATSDDGIPKNCGISKLCAKSGELLWFVKTRGAVKGDIAIDGKKLYVQDTYGTLYCLDCADGSQIWTAKSTLPRVNSTRMGVTIAKDLVIAGFQSMLHAYDKTSGKLVWLTEMSGCEGAPSRIVFDEKRERLIISRHWKSLTCVDLADGKLIWENFDRRHCWYRTSTPCLLDDGIYLGGLYTVAKLCPDSGKTLFTKPSSGRMDVAGAPACDGKSLFFPTGDKGVVAIDKETLEFVSVFPAKTAKLFSSPYLYGNICTVESTPIISENKLIFTASDGCIYIYNKDTAELEKRICTCEPVLSCPVIENGTIITAGFYGNIRAYKL